VVVVVVMVLVVPVNRAIYSITKVHTDNNKRKSCNEPVISVHI